MNWIELVVDSQKKMELNWICFSWELVKKIGIGPELIQNWNFKRLENDSLLFFSIFFECICCKKHQKNCFTYFFGRKNEVRIEIGIDFSRIGRNWSELELNWIGFWKHWKNWNWIFGIFRELVGIGIELNWFFEMMKELESIFWNFSRIGWNWNWIELIFGIG